MNSMHACMHAACKTASYRFHELHGPHASLGSTHVRIVACTSSVYKRVRGTASQGPLYIGGGVATGQGEGSIGLGLGLGFGLGFGPSSEAPSPTAHGATFHSRSFLEPARHGCCTHVEQDPPIWMR